jgi:hypothetical protein
MYNIREDGKDAKTLLSAAGTKYKGGQLPQMSDKQVMKQSNSTI